MYIAILFINIDFCVKVILVFIASYWVGACSGYAPPIVSFGKVLPSRRDFRLDEYNVGENVLEIH